MSAIEFGDKIISLEWYLANADPHILDSNDHLIRLIDRIDPRLMVTESLNDRVAPLTASDLAQVRQQAFIKPGEEIETFRFSDPYWTVTDDSEWWEVLGDPVTQLSVCRANLRPTTVEDLGWELLFLKREPDAQNGDNFSYYLGWINPSEIEILRGYADRS